VLAVSGWVQAYGTAVLALALVALTLVLMLASSVLSAVASAVSAVADQQHNSPLDTTRRCRGCVLASSLQLCSSRYCRTCVPCSRLTQVGIPRCKKYTQPWVKWQPHSWSGRPSERKSSVNPGLKKLRRAQRQELRHCTGHSIAQG
jgi:hypothetical protein